MIEPFALADGRGYLRINAFGGHRKKDWSSNDGQNSALDAAH